MEFKFDFEEVYKLKDLMHQIKQEAYAQGYAEAKKICFSMMLNKNDIATQQQIDLAEIHEKQKLNYIEQFYKILFDSLNKK